MQNSVEGRRGFLKRLAVAVGGLATIPALTTPALAGRSRFRGGYGIPYGGFRIGSNRRFYGGGYGIPYGGGYGGGYGVPYGGGYGGGYYGAPVVPYTVPVNPYRYGGGGYGGYGFPPMMKLQKSQILDPYALLES